MSDRIDQATERARADFCPCLTRPNVWLQAPPGGPALVTPEELVPVNTGLSCTMCGRDLTSDQNVIALTAAEK